MATTTTHKNTKTTKLKKKYLYACAYACILLIFVCWFVLADCDLVSVLTTNVRLTVNELHIFVRGSTTYAHTLARALSSTLPHIRNLLPWHPQKNEKVKQMKYTKLLQMFNIYSFTTISNKCFLEKGVTKRKGNEEGQSDEK